MFHAMLQGLGSSDYGLRVEAPLDRGSTAPSATFHAEDDGRNYNLANGLRGHFDFLIADLQIWAFDCPEKPFPNAASAFVGSLGGPP